MSRRDAIGYVFFHEQDVQRAVEHCSLHIGFGAADHTSDEDAVQIGEQLVQRLRIAGFVVQWSGTAKWRPKIEPFVWQKSLGALCLGSKPNGSEFGWQSATERVPTLHATA